MGDMKKTNGKYVGRKLMKEGVHEGKAWKKYKFTFDVEGKELNFHGFQPWTKKDGTTKKGAQPDDLKEGMNYNISYTEKIVEGLDYPVKNVICFFVGTSQEGPNYEKTDAREPTGETASGVPTGDSCPSPIAVGLRMLTTDEVKEMATMYKKQADPKMMSPNHFLGTIIKTENKDLVKFVDDIYKEMIE